MSIAVILGENSGYSLFFSGFRTGEREESEAHRGGGRLAEAEDSGGGAYSRRRGVGIRGGRVLAGGVWVKNLILGQDHERVVMQKQTSEKKRQKISKDNPKISIDNTTLNLRWPSFSDGMSFPSTISSQIIFRKGKRSRLESGPDSRVMPVRGISTPKLPHPSGTGTPPQKVSGGGGPSHYGESLWQERVVPSVRAGVRLVVLTWNSQGKQDSGSVEPRAARRVWLMLEPLCAWLSKNAGRSSPSACLLSWLPGMPPPGWPSRGGPYLNLDLSTYEKEQEGMCRLLLILEMKGVSTRASCDKSGNLVAIAIWRPWRCNSDASQQCWRHDSRSSESQLEPLLHRGKNLRCRHHDLKSLVTFDLRHWHWHYFAHSNKVLFKNSYFCSAFPQAHWNCNCCIPRKSTSAKKYEAVLGGSYDRILTLCLLWKL